MSDAMSDESELAPRGGEESIWEERFEAQINAFFDEAIARVPGFVDRNLKSFRRVMMRNVSPRTGLADVAVGLRNMLAGASKAAGGPDFSTTSYTHDALLEAFEREVVSPAELESLLARLFSEFEEEQWQRLADRASEASDEERAGGALEARAEAEVATLRAELGERIERGIAHDPLLAQALRSGLKVGLPATLGFVLLGGAHAESTEPQKGDEGAGRDRYHRLLDRLGDATIPSWLGAVGWAGGLVGALALGGAIEYAINSVRDIKGTYIRQLNTARYALLYGDSLDDDQERGIIHLVRGLEREFARVDADALIAPGAAPFDAAGAEDAVREGDALEHAGDPAVATPEEPARSSSE